VSDIDEAELLGAARAGAELSPPAEGSKRRVDAALLRRCCLEFKGQIDPRGLRLTNVAVTGQLDLAGLAVPFRLDFEGCEFDAAPTVEGAQLFQLSLTGCRLPGLLGNGLRLRRDLDLSRSRIAGAHWTSASTSKRSAIWLCESEIDGRLLCVDTSIDGLGDRAVQADRIRVGGAVRLIHDFRASGEIRLIGAQIGGSLDLTGARIESPREPCFDLADATIAGSMFVIEGPGGDRPAIRGRMDLGSAQIGGRLVFRNADIEAGPGDPAADSSYAEYAASGTAVYAPRITVGAELMVAGRCVITGGIDLSMGKFSVVSVGPNCQLHAPGRTALNLASAQISSLVRLDHDATVEGTIRLSSATIDGELALHGRLSEPDGRSLVSAHGMTVGGDVSLDRLRTDGGRLNFRGATLGSVNADDAQLHNAAGYSISLRQAIVRGGVRLVDGFSSTGLVMLNRCRMDGPLLLSGGSFSCPGPAHRNEQGHAIVAVSAELRGGMDLGWTAVSPSVDFTNASTTYLADDPAAWPERFSIAGLSYERFETPHDGQAKPIWDQAARCGWLGRQTLFDSGPYEQAARVFRQHGYADEAEQILMAQRRRARQVGKSAATWPRRAADAAYALVGYGYRPLRVLWMLAILLVLVAGSLALPAGRAVMRASNGNGQVYSTSGPVSPPPRAEADSDPCGDGQVRCFNPVLYAMDTVVPLISLDQRSTWYPDPHVRNGELMLWWLSLATLLGWVLSSILVLSLARLSRSS
jgi:uncharacterized protein YjbI with pentapeptide repeats